MQATRKITALVGIVTVGAIIASGVQAWEDGNYEDVRFDCYHNAEYFGNSLFPEGCEILHDQQTGGHPPVRTQLPGHYHIVARKHTEECIIEAVFAPIWGG